MQYGKGARSTVNGNESHGQKDNVLEINPL